jgi:hypothetical protein
MQFLGHRLRSHHWALHAKPRLGESSRWEANPLTPAADHHFWHSTRQMPFFCNTALEITLITFAYDNNLPSNARLVSTAKLARSKVDEDTRLGRR